jgi:glutathione S-transferase
MAGMSAVMIVGDGILSVALQRKQMIKLIGSLASPFVRKARIVLAEKKIDYQLVLENVWAPDTTIHTFNPIGKVPCLVMEDGEAVFDSRVICEYVDTLSPVGRLIPQSGRERVEVRCWEALADGVLEAAVLIRLESTLRNEGERSESWVARQQRKVDEGLDAISQGLAGKPWCSNNHFSLADVAVGCALGYLDFRMPELNWREKHSNLEKHFAKLSQRQSFIDTIPA